MKYDSEQKVEDYFRQPVFWQTSCYTFALHLVTLIKNPVSTVAGCPRRVGNRACSFARLALRVGIAFLAKVPDLVSWSIQLSN